MKVLDLFSGTYACGDSLNPDFSVTTASARVIPRRVATMTAYDSIERGAADECEPLRGRRPRTFTLTHLLVACGAVCVCAIAATTVVNTHLANFDEDYQGGAQLGQPPIHPQGEMTILEGKPSRIDCQADLKKAMAALADLHSKAGGVLSEMHYADQPEGPEEPEFEEPEPENPEPEGPEPEEPEEPENPEFEEPEPENPEPEGPEPEEPEGPEPEESEEPEGPEPEEPEGPENPEPEEPEFKPYVKTAGRALRGNNASGACSARLYYDSLGIKACEEKCNQCGDCKGFVDNHEKSNPYCVFKKATNVYRKASKDWYAKPI